MQNRTLVKMGDLLFICYQTGAVAWKELQESRRKKVGLLSEHPASFSATLLFQNNTFFPLYLLCLLCNLSHSRQCPHNLLFV